MICPACSRDMHPDIAGDQTGRFVYQCSVQECKATIGPVDGRHVQKVAGAGPGRDFTPLAVSSALVSPEPQRARGTPSGGHTTALPSVVETTPPGTQSVAHHLAALRARLDELDAAIVQADAMRAERKVVRRMLSAAEKTVRTKSNVIPIGKASST